MHYEIYVDSLFIINFTMNLYLLIWVNKSTFRTATPGRMILGATMGAVGFLITCFGVGIPCIRIIVGLVIGVIGMPIFTFSVKSLRMFLKLLKQLVIYSFLMGGMLLFLIRLFPGIRQYSTSVMGILGVAGVTLLLFGDTVMKGEEKNNLCSATLIRREKKKTVNALVDSGNSLTEPVSGKPVCVIDSSLYEELWEGDISGIRVIPYQSIGKPRGIMLGYPLEKLQVTLDDICLDLTDVYVAVSREPVSGQAEADIKMIMNPKILKR